jgi:hypothetical protein
MENTIERRDVLHVCANEFAPHNLGPPTWFNNMNVNLY